jgi:hypothetical protein
LIAYFVAGNLCFQSLSIKWFHSWICVSYTDWSNLWGCDLDDLPHFDLFSDFCQFPTPEAQSWRVYLCRRRNMYVDIVKRNEVLCRYVRIDFLEIIVCAHFFVLRRYCTNMPLIPIWAMVKYLDLFILIYFFEG